MKNQTNKLFYLNDNDLRFVCVSALSVAINAIKKKYDVSIKAASNLGGEWVFTPNIDEISVEIPYSGDEMRVWIDSWNLPNHPRWGSDWFEPATSGANVFHKRTFYIAPDGKRGPGRNPIKEKGEYIITCEADSTSDLWNCRFAHLIIIIY